MMTKEVAIELMKQGTKITHHYFDKKEWMTMLSDGNILLEDGVKCKPSDFWRDRTSPGWDDGYAPFDWV